MAAKKKTLEQEFKAAVKAVRDKIHEGQEAYRKAEVAAEKLAKKHGITVAYQDGLAGTHQIWDEKWEPFSDKWASLNKGMMADETGLYWEFENHDPNTYEPIGEEGAWSFSAYC